LFLYVNHHHDGFRFISLPCCRYITSVDWLLNDKLDAIVYDRPNLLSFAQTKGNEKVEVVGKVFAPQDYGMATAQGSELREKINRTILSIIEKGQMDEIRSKWFGSEP
jgi:ABC-type amino acid transport substrate-binding protein